MSFYNCKKVLVTGGTGLIGRPLLDLLLEAKANITCVSLDSPNDIDDKINFIINDTGFKKNVYAICQDCNTYQIMDNSIPVTLSFHPIQNIRFNNRFIP